MKTMKKILRKFPVRLLIISLALALLVAVIALNRPAAQSLAPTPIPLTSTVTPTPYQEPGDTTGLIVISVVLVFIIVIGVIMGQNLTRPRQKRKPQGKNQSK